MKLNIPFALNIFPNGDIQLNQPELGIAKTYPTTTPQKEIIQDIRQVTDEIIENFDTVPKIKKASYYSNQKAFEDTIWIELNFDRKSDLKKGIFEKMLPILGHISNVISLIGNTLSTLMSLRLTTSDAFNSGASETNEIAQWSIGIPSGILNFIILLVIYIYSGSSNLLADIGKVIDSKITRKIRKNHTELLTSEQTESNWCSSYKKIAISATAGISIVFLQLMSANDTYQDILSKGIRLNIEGTEIGYDLIIVLAWMTMISTVLSSTVFQGSFAKDCIEDLTAEQDKKPIDSETQLTETSLLVEQTEKNFGVVRI